jgi:hypothetical protein
MVCRYRELVPRANVMKVIDGKSFVAIASILLSSCASDARVNVSHADAYPKVCDQGSPEGGGAEYRAWKEEQERNKCSAVGLK